MPLPRTGAGDLAAHLDGLGIAAGARLVVHSRLLAFGQLDGGAEMAAGALLGRIGPAGTLIVPTYTFDAAQPYDPVTRPGEGTGALSELIRQMPGAIRSRCPIHNHAGIGPDSRLLAGTDPARSIGPGSDFAAMLDGDFTLVLLGCGFTEGCTYLHHMEAMAEVPYREWIELRREVWDADGRPHSMTVRYYGHVGERRTADFEAVRHRLAERGLLGTAPCPFGASYVCRLADLHQVAAEMLADDPFVLVGGRHGRP